MKVKREENGVALELEFKGEEKGLGLGFFVKCKGGVRCLADRGDGRGVMSGLGYFEGDFW